MSKEKVLNSAWKVLKFGECIYQLNTGLNPRKNFSLGTGELKYITAKNLTKSGTIDFSKCDFIDEDAKKIINNRSDIKVGDILFSSRAPIGHSHLIKDEPYYYDIGESIFSIRVNKEIILPEYLCLYLSSDYFVKLASKHTTGSIILEIRISDLMNTKIIVPTKHTQKSIAECLNKIDRKIELNSLINDNLQQQASLLYDYWFTQFDFPNENGEPYKSSGGKMVWNEKLKREIPEGWNPEKLGELCKFRNGINYAKEVEGNREYRIVNVRNISAYNLLLNESELDCITLPAKQADKYLLSSNDIIIARSGIPGSTRLIWKIEKLTIFCGFIICASPIDELNRLYIAYWLKRLEGTSATKTGGSILQNVSQDTLKDLLLPTPKAKIIDQFNVKIFPILNAIQNIIGENNELIALRDWLLPMLMNGQATVEDEPKSTFCVSENNTKNKQDPRFALWLQNQGLAARGDIDNQTLREIFDAMDEDDK